ncbi:glycerophosphodiester phosphodiesterase family protein [Lactobacillus sp. YT155]|uniref:glycerophosphodiester phosphodiesterase n=1 Tax=Lactobacillus sp. YT155 TaxID=3060955 RepID=UPI00265D9296|nr:glycerophosphodiester phosphodiesterase family protein [Lactobacillus sp. YT155]MDO1605926.1 glycerophosphodiester phosphodiesterase family protein [Lactobacillus sp. YT155]
MFKKSSLSIFLIFIFIFNSAFIVVGHRGDPIKATEETFQSFDTAFNERTDYVELDVHLSKDNRLVVSHDDNLMRLTGKNLLVSQNDFNTISQLTVANGEHIHSLDEVLAKYQNNPQAKFLIETKRLKGDSSDTLESTISQVVQKYHMQDRVMFHSFSSKSIKALAKYFPNNQRIFISGSLKRINFEVFKYSTGVNISSDLVTSKLVSQLHKMSQKVYVWDKMNEDPAQWNWLVNMPIDGVVTNYPETGVKYRDLEKQASSQTLNTQMTYMNEKPSQTFENPYIKNKVTGQTEYLNSYEVKKQIIVDNKPYLQIADNKFVSADNFIDSKYVAELLPYMNSTIRVRDNHLKHSIYASPNIRDTTGTSLLTNKEYAIEGFKKDGSKLWIKTQVGWVLSDNVLIKFTEQVSQQSYLNLDSSKKLTEIDLSQQPLPLATDKSIIKDFNFSTIQLKPIQDFEI